MVKFLKKLIGRLIRVPIFLVALPLSILILVFKYSEERARNNKIIIDRLVLKGGKRKRKK